jgi:predicted dehydrogenase
MGYRIAIAGTGYIGAIHAQAVLNQPDAEAAAVVTTRADMALDFCDKYNIPEAYASVEDLLREAQVDGLIICTPNALHADQAVQALRAGVHVMVEKPMAMNAAEAQTMLAASQEAGCRLMVAHCWRFEEEVIWLQSQVQTGQLGKIIRTKGYGVHENWGPSGWFTQKALAGGGALADMGIHAVDIARFLLGDPLPVSVYARTGTHYIDADVDDTGILIINWEGGIVSYIESGWFQPHSDGIEASTQLYTEGGFASLFPTRLELRRVEEKRVEIIDPGFTFPRDDHAPQSMYDRQMAHFIHSIRTGNTPVPGGQEGLINMQIIDAAYQSSRTGLVVNLR